MSFMLFEFCLNFFKQAYKSMAGDMWDSWVCYLSREGHDNEGEINYVKESRSNGLNPDERKDPFPNREQGGWLLSQKLGRRRAGN